jgi:hypothetical protein
MHLAKASFGYPTGGPTLEGRNRKTTPMTYAFSNTTALARVAMTSTAHPCSTAPLVHGLETERYIGQHATILVVGEVGVGKIHLAH